MAHKKVTEKEAEEMRLWHPVFALFPVRVAEHDCRWLETIERRYSYVDVLFDYGMGWHPWRFWKCYYEDIEYRAVSVKDWDRGL